MFGLFRKTNIRKTTDADKNKSDLKDEECCGYSCGSDPEVTEHKEEREKASAASS